MLKTETYNDIYMRSKIKDVLSPFLSEIREKQLLRYIDPVSAELVKKYYGIGCEKKTLQQIMDEFKRDKAWVFYRLKKATQKILFLLNTETN